MLYPIPHMENNNVHSRMKKREINFKIKFEAQSIVIFKIFKIPSI